MINTGRLCLPVSCYVSAALWILFLWPRGAELSSQCSEPAFERVSNVTRVAASFLTVAVWLRKPWPVTLYLFQTLSVWPLLAVLFPAVRTEEPRGHSLQWPAFQVWLLWPCLCWGHHPQQPHPDPHWRKALQVSRGQLPIFFPYLSWKLANACPAGGWGRHACHVGVCAIRASPGFLSWHLEMK